MIDERKEAARIYQELVRNIARGLGWLYDEPREEGAETWASISLPVGERLLFQRYKDRIEISGRFPHGYAPYGEHHSITVTCRKDAYSIATSITRRLLPKYVPAYQATAARQKADRETRAKAEALAAELAAICGGEILRNDATRFRHYGQLHIEGHASDGGADLTLNGLSSELAARVLGVIRGYMRIPARAEEDRKPEAPCPSTNQP